MTIEAGPFYLAWVDAGVAFDPTVHNVMDEYVFSARRVLSEGDKPKIEAEIRNPHIGILNSARKTWVWFSYDTGTTAGIVPLFNGRVVATPSNVFSEVITLQFVGWPTDYFERLQRLAETMKVAPFYDAVFIDPLKRDDPDSILEGYSALWHVDPVSLDVTASDILIGEDGNVSLTADQVFYDSLNMRLNQAPLTAVLMDATVSWTQTARGFVDMGNQVIDSYGGDGIISDWPKPLQSLDGGWSVQYSIATDVHGISHALTGSMTYSWRNTEKQHSDGDALSYDLSMTVPQMGGATSLGYILTSKTQSGVLDPFAVDEDGDPAPINIPASSDVTSVYCPVWQVNTSLVLRYDAARQRTERITFLLQADLQAIINDPLITQNSETITKTGADVGIPIVNLLNWTAVSGQSVTTGQIIFPDDPSLPGGRSVQIALNDGTAGTVEPNFSDIPGTTTADNTVTWSSLGTQNPTEGALDWTAVSHVPAGEIILPRLPLWTTWAITLQPGLAQFPKVGVGISLYQIVQGSNGYFFVCTLDGTTGIVEPAWPTTYGATVDDAAVTWTCIGNTLPDGKTYFLATVGGLTSAAGLIPQFGSHGTLHDTVTDNAVTWTSIGSGDIPAGGTPGNVWASSYFPSTRGLRSLEYLICVARAHMLMRSRAVEIGFSCSFDDGIALTCRKTAEISDSRLAGGGAVGKITRAELSIDGDRGEAICNVTMGCAVGFGGSASAATGSPAYVDASYIGGNYQQFTGQTILPSNLTDVGYTPPVAATDDDGLVFPLDKGQIVVSESIKGSLALQGAAIGSAFGSMARAAQVGQITPSSIPQSIFDQQIIIQANANSVQLAIQRNPIYYDAQIKPVNAGPFFDYYKVTTTKLQIPQGINLEATSSP